MFATHMDVGSLRAVHASYAFLHFCDISLNSTLNAIVDETDCVAHQASLAALRPEEDSSAQLLPRSFVHDRERKRPFCDFSFFPTFDRSDKP